MCSLLVLRAVRTLRRAVLYKHGKYFVPEVIAISLLYFRLQSGSNADHVRFAAEVNVTVNAELREYIICYCPGASHVAAYHTKRRKVVKSSRAVGVAACQNGEEIGEVLRGLKSGS